MPDETNIAEEEATEEVKTTLEENAESAETAENTGISASEEISETISSIEAGESGESAEAAEPNEVAAKSRNLRKERIGIVVSNKMQKTIVVKIEESVKHSKYSKIMKRSIKFKAHDEKNECDIGDKVLIMETRPLSKDKRWRLVEILEKVK